MTISLNHELGEINKTELKNEIKFLSNPIDGVRSPLLIASEINDTNGWLIQQRFPGRLLLDLINEKQQIDPKRIVLDILDQLVKLENDNLYHNDIRIWNVIVSEERYSQMLCSKKLSSNIPF